MELGIFLLHHTVRGQMYSTTSIWYGSTTGYVIITSKPSPQIPHPSIICHLNVTYVSNLQIWKL